MSDTTGCNTAAVLQAVDAFLAPAGWTVTNELGGQAEAEHIGAPRIVWTFVDGTTEEGSTQEDETGHIIESELQLYDVKISGRNVAEAERLRFAFRVALYTLFSREGAQVVGRMKPAQGQITSSAAAVTLRVQLRVPVYDELFKYAPIDTTALHGTAQGSADATPEAAL